MLFKGSKLENQHTRKTLGTLSWVYKTSDYLRVIGPGSPCWSYQSEDLHPAKTAWHRGTPPPCHCRNRCILDRMGYRCILHGKWNKLSGDQNPLRLPVSGPYISVNNTKLHSATVRRATGQVMVPDPPSRAQGRQTHSQVKAAENKQ